MRRLGDYFRRVRLGFWFARRGVTFIIFDFDDTLNEAYPLFRRAFAKCDEFLANIISDPDCRLARVRLREINDAYFLSLGVNPGRWNFVFYDLLTEFGVYSDRNWRTLLEFAGEIYKTAPPLKEGAFEVLSLLSGVRPLGLATHANREWHALKMTFAGIGQFFVRQAVIDENGQKDGAAWSSVLTDWGLKPERVFVVEDNLISLRHLAAIGVKNLVWLRNESVWSVYTEGALPPNLLVIEDIRELLRPWKLRHRE